MTIPLSLCCATGALLGSPCSSPQCPRRVTIGCRGGQQCRDPSRNQPPDGCNQPVLVDGGALYELGSTIIPPFIAPLERFEVNLMDFEVGRSAEVPNPTRPEQWAPWEPRLPQPDAHNYETGCWVIKQATRREEEQEFDFLLVYFFSFEMKSTNRCTSRGRKISSGMRSLRYGMRRPSPKKEPRRLFPGPLPPILPIPAEMLRLNWLQRSGKVFWRLQNTDGGLHVKINRPMWPCSLSRTRRARNVMPCRLPLSYPARF